ncbi:hypothetical protein [uncultured Herbaspirillum sp.]|uniref:hypothetical protein n=1 Tax=uncultured Herbaspirillum sp. TaxID=160236 RepID=UPI0026147996|nr:hypothetical protein [uncultured Herbaspirillum sp.]
MAHSDPDPVSTRAAPALLRPPAMSATAQTPTPPDHIQPDPAQVIEPDGTEDPLANADDGLLPRPGSADPDRSPPLPPTQENPMHKPQDTPPVEVPPLDPTPPQDPIPHQNPMAGR